jgi:glycosyltransferase involved in cell wall biosynthesis
MSKLTMPPIVSVVIPVYNHAHRVGSAISSVLSQTYGNYEVIVVNDGSTDNLAETLLQFTGIRLINHDANFGRAAARNTGVLAARGEYIAFLDADDQWKPTKLARQIRFLEENKDISICFTGYEMLLPDGSTRKMPFPKVQQWERYLLKYAGLSDGSVPMIRRSCFDKTGLQDMKLMRYQNWDWLLRAAGHACEMGYIDEWLSIKSKSQKRPPASLREAGTVYLVKKHSQLFDAYGFYGRSAISLYWYNLSIDYFYEKNWRKGIHYLFKAMTTWPFQRPGLYFRLLDALLGTNIEALIQNSNIYTHIKGISR